MWKRLSLTSKLFLILVTTYLVLNWWAIDNTKDIEGGGTKTEPTCTDGRGVADSIIPDVMDAIRLRESIYKKINTVIVYELEENNKYHDQWPHRHDKPP